MTTFLTSEVCTLIDKGIGNFGLTMSTSIPMNIPPQRRRGSGTLMPLGSFVPGSLFSASVASSIPRESMALSVPVDNPVIEQKLDRTRKISTIIQSSVSKVVSFPTTVGDINRRWALMLVDQFRLKHGLDPVAPEAQVDFETKDCKKSVGEFSTTHMIDISISKDESYSFVVKMIPENDPCRAYVFEAGLFEKENEMYFELLPAIKFFLQSGDRSVKTILDDLIPECIYGSHNTDGAGVLVFASITQSGGFKDCCDPCGLDIKQLRVIVKSMSEFHASGHAFLAKNKLGLVERRYPNLTKDMFSNGLLINEIQECFESYSTFIDSVGRSHLMAAKAGLCVTKLKDMRLQLARLKGCDPVNLVQGLRRQSQTGSLNTIIHGELWEKNVMLNSRMQVKVLDWKNTKVASATLDLAFLMLTSTSADIREDYTNQILEMYHQTFCETLHKLAPKCVLPTLKELQQDYKESLQYALLQALCMLVAEMHFMTNTISKAGDDEVDDLSDRLKIYEVRALSLFHGIDLCELEDEDDDHTFGACNNSDSDMDEYSMSPGNFDDI